MRLSRSSITFCNRLNSLTTFRPEGGVAFNIRQYRPHQNSHNKTNGVSVPDYMWRKKSGQMCEINLTKSKPKPIIGISPQVCKCALADKQFKRNSVIVMIGIHRIA